MEALDPLAEHRPVSLFTHSPRNMDDSIRIDPEQVPVVGEVMNGAQGEAVDHRRNALWGRVGDDVCRLDEISLAESAHRAFVLVGAQHIEAEALLVQADLDLA